MFSGAVQGAPDHVCYWAVSGCCQFNVLISIWGLCWCIFFSREGLKMHLMRRFLFLSFPLVYAF